MIAALNEVTSPLERVVASIQVSIRWTKHPSRLARDLGRKQWGDEGYAQEELVAELGAAFLCADLELAIEPREENASYIANWLDVLKNNTRFVFKAAAHAQRAADYLRAFSGTDAARAAGEQPPFHFSVEVTE